MTISKVSVFGTELSFGRPQTVTNVLWIAAVYWLLRYYQYSRVFHGTLSKAVRDYIFHNNEPLVIKKLTCDEPSLLDPFGSANVIPRFNYSILRQSYKSTKLDLKIRLERISSDGEYSDTEQVGEREVQLEGSTYFWFKFKAWLSVIFKTTIFTDWMLPYIVFALPILYLVSKAFVK